MSTHPKTQEGAVSLAELIAKFFDSASPFNRPPSTRSARVMNALLPVDMWNAIARSSKQGKSAMMDLFTFYFGNKPITRDIVEQSISWKPFKPTKAERRYLRGILDLKKRYVIGQFDKEMQSDLYPTLIMNTLRKPHYPSTAEVLLRLAPGTVLTGLGGALLYKPIKDIIQGRYKTLDKKRLIAGLIGTGLGAALTKINYNKLISGLKGDSYFEKIKELAASGRKLPNRLLGLLSRKTYRDLVVKAVENY